MGVGQFQNGEKGKGVALAVGQGLCAVTAVASLAVALSLRGEDGLYGPADARTARALNMSYLAGAYTCAALYLYGVVDGLVTWAHRPD